MEKQFAIGARTASLLSVHTDLDKVVKDTYEAIAPVYGPDIDEEFKKFLNCIDTAQEELRRYIAENIQTNLWDTVNLEKETIEV